MTSAANFSVSYRRGGGGGGYPTPNVRSPTPRIPKIKKIIIMILTIYNLIPLFFCLKMSRTSSKLTALRSGPSIAMLFFRGISQRTPPPPTQHALDLSHPKPKFLYESLNLGYRHTCLCRGAHCGQSHVIRGSVFYTEA